MAISPPIRGGTNLPSHWVTNNNPQIKSFSMQYAWGSSPSRAIVTYAAQEAAMTLPEIPYGSLITFTTKFGHLFVGICRSDVGSMSDQGHSRTLEFDDLRAVLDWDLVYCYFNRPVKKIINNVYGTYYESMLPNNFFTNQKTTHDAPFTAKAIIEMLMAAPSVETNWAASGHIWHSDQFSQRTYGRYTYRLYPVLNLDFQGVKLGDAINQVCEAQGLTYIHSPITTDYFRLWFSRLGEGYLQTYNDGYSPSASVGKIFPPNSSNRAFGVTDAENPARITILGDRNLVQIHNIDMVPDWNPVWNSIFDFNDLVYLVFTNFTSDATIGSVITQGQSYASVAGDGAEHLIGWQLAAARAEVITVGEFAAVMGSQYADYRKFNGRSRLNMPASMYIRNILFRAFRPPNQICIPNILTRSTVVVNSSSLQLTNSELVRCTHSPATGIISTTSNPTDGNGYAIAQGYRIGQDAFKTLTPETFDLTTWNDYRAIWQHIPFQVDDNGEDGGGFIIFDEPIINCTDLIGEDAVAGAGDKKITFFKAFPTITHPAVRASLTFACDRFVYRNPTNLGSGQVRDGVETVSGLHAEVVMPANLPTVTWVELSHSDGQLATYKAHWISESLLKRKNIYYQGGYTRFFEEDETTLGMSNMYSRVSIDISANGYKEDVEFTGDCRTTAFIPSRDFDRARNINMMLPGQKELKEQARMHQLMAAGLKSSPNLRNEILQMFKGEIGSQAKNVTRTVRVVPEPS